MRITLISIGILAVLLLVLVTFNKETTLVKGVQQGKLVLHCHVGNGYVPIEPSKVTGLVEGTWTFTNGSASNCYVKEAK